MCSIDDVGGSGMGGCYTKYGILEYVDEETVTEMVIFGSVRRGWFGKGVVASAQPFTTRQPLRLTYSLSSGDKGPNETQDGRKQIRTP